MNRGSRLRVLPEQEKSLISPARTEEGYFICGFLGFDVRPALVWRSNVARTQELGQPIDLSEPPDSLEIQPFDRWQTA